MNELIGESMPDPTTPDTLEFELGSMLGERKAFGLIAGRCSAAHAACLRNLRDRKLYKSRCTSWEEFCPKYLRLSRGHANRIIQTLEEFGPDYFELAELTRITPEEFRAIGPEVKDKVLHANGEAIALLPENAGKLTAAVEALRRHASPEIPVPLSSRTRLVRLERRCDDVTDEFQKLSGPASREVDQLRLSALLRRMLTTLGRINLEMAA
ncbi:MAG: hypothetical protein LAQ69_31805 [Acidobacteriia bacterium]|nr:hypothetical protein [Terriglobia bacterium]